MGWSGRAPARQRWKLARGAKDEEHVMSQQINARVVVVGVDIGKNSFHVVGQDARGQIVLRQRWSRHQVEARFANMPSCLISLEACVGAHHFSRRLKALGHDARLMPARYVRPYSRGQKNDFRDAEAIAEAVQRPTMKFVVTKTADQLDLQALRRVRERRVSQRTAIINQIRAFLLKRGIAVRQGQHSLRAESCRTSWPHRPIRSHLACSGSSRRWLRTYASSCIWTRAKICFWLSGFWPRAVVMSMPFRMPAFSFVHRKTGINSRMYATIC